MYYKKLQAKDIYLSPMDLKNDYLLTTKWMNEDDEIAANNGFLSSSLNEEKVAKKLEQWDTSEAAFSIVLQENNQLIGNISFFNQSSPVIGAEMGVYIAENYRGKGYGKQAITLMLKHAFETLNYQHVHISVYSYNTKAMQTYASLGFKHAGKWRKAKYHQGQFHDIILMDILKEEYFNKTSI